MSYLRYDVYYASGDIDGEVPLPARAESGAVAVCVNGEHDRYRAWRGRWIHTTETQACERMDKQREA